MKDTDRLAISSIRDLEIPKVISCKRTWCVSFCRAAESIIRRQTDVLYNTAFVAWMYKRSMFIEMLIL